MQKLPLSAPGQPAPAEASSFIYIVISRTNTGVGRILRRVGKMQYNHTALALDRGLEQMYAFARTERYGYLLGRLVRETAQRYTLRHTHKAPVVVFAVPVSAEQYRWVQSFLREVLNDPEYMYNLFSVITYPLLKGFSTYKAYSCIEFVMYILQQLGFPLDQPLPRYRPDDLLTLLKEYQCYQGDLLGYMTRYTTESGYDSPVRPELMWKSAVALVRISSRTLLVLQHWVLDKTHLGATKKPASSEAGSKNTKLTQ